MSEKHVRLRNSIDGQVVSFAVTPEINETRNVAYNNVDVMHAPGNFKTYRSTANRVFQLSGIRLVSRNFEEAQKNSNMLQTLRSWTLPYFGDGTKNNIRSLGNAKVGLPPPTLYLYAYASRSESKNLYKIPVIIENLNFTYPADVDYITPPGNNSDPFPAIMSMDIQLSEVHSPKKFRGFNLAAFKAGTLEGF